MLLPEERAVLGIFPHQSVAANITIGALDRVSRFGLVDHGREGDAADALIGRPASRRPAARGHRDPERRQPAEGGARALALRVADLLMLDEPTRGIDLAAKAEI